MVRLACRSMVKADRSTDHRPRNDRDRSSELVELEGRIGREQDVAASKFGMAKGNECPSILDRERVGRGQLRVGRGGRGRWPQRAHSDRQRIYDRELTSKSRP